MPARSSQGAKLQLSISSVFTDIALVTGISGPNPEGETFDATHLQSTDNAREFVDTVWAAGEVTAELLYDPAASTHRRLFTLLKARTVESWKIIYPDGSTGTEHAFSARVIGLTHDGAVAEGLKATVTLQITGTVTPPTPS